MSRYQIQSSYELANRVECVSNVKGKENQMTFAINYYTLRLEVGICPVLSESFDHRYIKAQLKSGSKPKPKSKLSSLQKRKKNG